MHALDLKSLLEGKPVTFSLPRQNSRWMVENFWIHDSEENWNTVILNMEIIFPVLKDPKCDYETSVNITTSRIGK